MRAEGAYSETEYRTPDLPGHRQLVAVYNRPDFELVAMRVHRVAKPHFDVVRDFMRLYTNRRRVSPRANKRIRRKALGGPKREVIRLVGYFKAHYWNVWYRFDSDVWVDYLPGYLAERRRRRGR